MAKDHPGGNRVPQRLSHQGDNGHEGYRGGQGQGARTPGVLPSPRRGAERHQATPPPGGPFGVQVQLNEPLHAQLWHYHHYVSLDHLQSAGVSVPTIVCMCAPPANAYWQWAWASPAPVVTITTALPPWAWIAIAPPAVAKFKYPAECVAHRCPGHPNKGPPYYSLNTAEQYQSSSSPALRTPSSEHHGDLALLAPHGLAIDPPAGSNPRIKPGIWFHDLPALATFRGTVAVVDAGTMQAGMAMAGVAQSRLEAYRTHVACRVGTFHEGEAMIFLLYARTLAQQLGVLWPVPDSEAEVGALRTYQERGHCGDGIHHLCTTVLGGERLSPTSAINVVTKPLHGITDLIVRVDAASQEPIEVDLTWLPLRPFSFLPPVTYRDQCLLSPTALSN